MQRQNKAYVSQKFQWRFFYRNILFTLHVSIVKSTLKLLFERKSIKIWKILRLKYANFATLYLENKTYTQAPTFTGGLPHPIFSFRSHTNEIQKRGHFLGGSFQCLLYAGKLIWTILNLSWFIRDMMKYISCFNGSFNFIRELSLERDT